MAPLHWNIVWCERNTNLCSPHWSVLSGLQSKGAVWIVECPERDLEWMMIGEADRGKSNRTLERDTPAHLSDSHLPQQSMCQQFCCFTLHCLLLLLCWKLCRRCLYKLLALGWVWGELSPGDGSESAMALLLDGFNGAASHHCLIRHRFKRRRKKRSERKGMSTPAAVWVRWTL